jgi:Rrf2 family protein
MVLFLGDYQEHKMLTREADYAVRIILHLSVSQIQNEPASAAKMAASLEIPYAFLRRILRRLALKKVVVSRRGRRGGVGLSGSCAEVTLLDVLRAIDQHKLCLNSCVANPGSCAREDLCPVTRHLNKTQKLLDQSLAGITFEELARHHLRLCRTHKRKDDGSDETVEENVSEPLATVDVK